jgi:hypothetical protein
MFIFLCFAEQGNPIWQSSWCFNVDIDSVNDTQDVQGLLSNKHLEYTGPICGSMLEKFKISFNTYYEVKELLGKLVTPFLLNYLSQRSLC